MNNGHSPASQSAKASKQAENHYRQKLLEQRSQLLALAESDSQNTDTVALDQQKVGRLSRMDAMQSQAMAKATEQLRAQQMVRIDAALRRLDANDYGFCQDCGENIAEKRLNFDPAATLCITCASQHEQP